MRAYKRLLKYVTVNTTSHEEAEKTPSGEGEYVLARLLAEEMKSLGLTDVHVDEHAVAEEMDQCVEILLEVVKAVAEK